MSKNMKLYIPLISKVDFTKQKDGQLKPNHKYQAVRVDKIKKLQELIPDKKGMLIYINDQQKNIKSGGSYMPMRIVVEKDLFNEIKNEVLSKGNSKFDVIKDCINISIDLNTAPIIQVTPKIQ
jgi:hypothetical protein